MMNTLRLLLVTLFCFQATWAQQQATVDSLKGLLKGGIHDSTRIKVYDKLIAQYLRTDSSLVIQYSCKMIELSENNDYPKWWALGYLHQGLMLAMRGHTKASHQVFDHLLVLAKNRKYLVGEARAYGGFATVERIKGNYKKALMYAYKALAIFEKEQYNPGIYRSHHTLGNASFSQGNYDQAIKHYQIALLLTKKMKRQDLEAAIRNNLGAAYLHKDNIVKALQHSLKSASMHEKLNKLAELTYNYSAIAGVYLRQKDYLKAEKYCLKAIKINQKSGSNQRMLERNYIDLAKVYNSSGNYTKSIDYTLKALKIAKILSDKVLVVSCYRSLAISSWELKNDKQTLDYLKQALEIAQQINHKRSVANILITFGEVYLAKKDYKQAIDYTQRGIKIARSIKVPHILKRGMNTLYKIYKASGNYKAALMTHILYKKTTDSLFNKENIQKTVRLQANYEFGKTIDSIKLIQANEKLLFETKLQKTELTKKLYRNTVFGVLVVSLLLVGFTFQVVRSRQKQKKLNLVLQDQKEELISLNEELKQSEDEVISQRDNIIAQKELLASQHHQLTQSIKAAEVIQSAILPVETCLNRSFEAHFVLFKPRDTVSGDFYWFSNKHDMRIMAVVDCTGHGVPGAFMSMMSYALLNEIIKIKHLRDPSQILEKLRAELKTSLKQDDLYQGYGMDMVLITLENESNEQIKVSFAGAKRPLWYITPQCTGIQEIAGDRISIGFRPHYKRSFNTHELMVPRGTLCYLTSDGLLDQNNTAMEKIGAKQLKQFLFDHHERPLDCQKVALESMLTQHMKGVSQRDDILLLGIKV